MGLEARPPRRAPSRRARRAPPFDPVLWLAQKTPGWAASLAFHGVLFSGLSLVVFANRIILADDFPTSFIRCGPRPEPPPLRLNPGLPLPIGNDLHQLARTQNADGSWSDRGRSRIEATSIATLAFVAAGVDRSTTDVLGASLARGLAWLEHAPRSTDTERALGALALASVGDDAALFSLSEDPGSEIPRTYALIAREVAARNGRLRFREPDFYVRPTDALWESIRTSEPRPRGPAAIEVAVIAAALRVGQPPRVTLDATPALRALSALAR